MSSEVLDVVDANDNVVGQTDMSELYEKKLLHRIVHVFVIHPMTGEVYFQKRSDSKSYLPGFYCTSAGGHVRSGESYERAAMRELKEELGLEVPVKKVHRTNFVINGHDRFIELFIAFADSGIDFKDGEVASGQFFSMDDAMELVNSGEKIHPQLDLCFRWLYANKHLVSNSQQPIFVLPSSPYNLRPNT
ncbi:NUDIX domain-containing protein [Candidatus Woesearchaeota archaeon]|nr:NUDIX domain-containing protein [Candidatus Woesearchaeota archaeon]